MATCYQELRRQGSAVLNDHPELEHSWKEESDGSVVLHFPKTPPRGFDISLTGNDVDIVLEAGGFHSHFDDLPDPQELISGALGFVRDLLSESMRLRVRYSNGKAYRWLLESSGSNGWKAKEETGLLFWNLFGEKSEEVFQNDQLPPRPDSSQN
jgi:hypothetical protein